MMKFDFFAGVFLKIDIEGVLGRAALIEVYFCLLIGTAEELTLKGLERKGLLY